MTDTAVIFDIIGRDKTSAAIAASGAAFNKFAIGLAAGAAFAGAKFVDMAGNFQQGMTRLKTGAGEVDSNMGLVAAGIKQMAGEVGESTKDLLKGMYLIESAGFHGAQGLDVLRVAAEGAKVGNADMATVADAVTTGLNAYRMGADKATAVTNALIAAEGQGKTNLEALSGSLATVAPIAAVAGVRLNEVLGAMSTMTGEGTDAASAATYLKQTIGQLANPTQKAQAEMKALGINAIDVQHALGKEGLASALTILTDAIKSKMGPSGDVVINKLRGAAGNADEFQKILANLPPTVQTYVGALATMTGGTKSMQAALELTGPNMEVFKHNTEVIDEKVRSGGSAIEGWTDVQKNFNQHVAEAKGTLEALGISIGQVLLPKAQRMLDVTMSAVTWFTKHKQVAHDLALAIGIGAGVFVAWRLAVLAATVVQKGYLVATTAIKVATWAWTAAQWLLNIAMDANPIGLVILAIAALVAIVLVVIKYHKQLASFFVMIWGYIWGFMKTIGAWFAGPFVDFFVKAGKDIAAPFIWLWHNIIEPVWHGIEAVIGLYIRIIVSYFNLWKFVIMNTVVPAIMWLWHNVIEPGVNAMGAGFTMLWHVIQAAGQGIAAAAMWLWHNVIAPVVAGVKLEFKGLEIAAMWLWHNVLEPAFHGIASAADWAWHNVLKPAFDGIMGAVRNVGHVFHEVFDVLAGVVSSGISSAIGAAKSMVNGFISVINSGIGGVNSLISTLNKVPGVDFPHIPTIPHLASGGLLTRGGMVRVGERGAETVVLPTGSAVYPHGSEPAGATGGGGNAGRRVRFTGNLDSAFATLFMKLVRTGQIQLD